MFRTRHEPCPLRPWLIFDVGQESDAVVTGDQSACEFVPSKWLLDMEGSVMLHESICWRRRSACEAAFADRQACISWQSKAPSAGIDLGTFRRNSPWGLVRSSLCPTNRPAQQGARANVLIGHVSCCSTLFRFEASDRLSESGTSHAR